MTERNYMVAVDGSENSDAAFYNTLDIMNKKKDRLYIVCAALSPPDFLTKLFKAADDIRENLITHASEVALDYGARARVAGVEFYTPMIVFGNHTGALITKACEERGCDFLVLGRRGKNPYKRLLLGSTAKYCVEHCDCNVVIVKAYFPTEEHADKSDVVEAEEAERERRIKETEGDKTEKSKEKEEREAAHIGVVVEEEEERKRRIEDERIIDDRKHHVVVEKEYLL